MRRRGLGRAARPSLVGTAARTAVVAGTATAVSGRVAAGQQGRAGAAPPPPTAVASPADPSPAQQAAGLSDEVFDQLRKLGELKESGILTDEEFAVKKARLLDL